MSGWIGVDFDGTLAEYGTWVGPDHVGKPIAPMVERVKLWLAQGREVRIFTARMFPFAVNLRPQDEIAYRADYTDRHREAGRRLLAVRMGRFRLASRHYMRGLRYWQAGG